MGNSTKRWSDDKDVSGESRKRMCSRGKLLAVIGQDNKVTADSNGYSNALMPGWQRILGGETAFAFEINLTV
jgi:hypothetical protein